MVILPNSFHGISPVPMPKESWSNTPSPLTIMSISLVPVPKECVNNRPTLVSIRKDKLQGRITRIVYGKFQDTIEMPLVHGVVRGLTKADSETACFGRLFELVFKPFCFGLGAQFVVEHGAAFAEAGNAAVRCSRHGVFVGLKLFMIKGLYVYYIVVGPWRTLLFL
jgi:hypothetical protein